MKSPLTIRPLLIALALVGACKGEPEPTRWDKKTAEVKENKTPAVDKSTVAKGGSLNTFFPKEMSGLSRTFTQEKLGFSEAKIKMGPAEAKVSISDTRNNPSAKAKFEKSTEKVAGFPLVTVGKKQTAVLVADRWQVKVSSSFLDASARKALLEKFDLSGLASHN